MIIVMQHGATKSQIDHMVDRVESLGLKPHVIFGIERTVIAAVGEKREYMRDSLESGPGVAEVVPILAPYRVADRTVKPSYTAVSVGERKIGNGNTACIVGPPAIESADCFRAVADCASSSAAGFVLARPWMIRRSPYSFQGLKEDGLRIARDATAERGLGLVVSVFDHSQLDLAVRYGDVLLAEPAVMSQTTFLEHLGRTGRPVIVSRNPASSLEDLLLAAEYVLSEGNPNVVLCEGGRLTTEPEFGHMFSIEDLHQLRRRTHLPILLDLTAAFRPTSLACRDVIGSVGRLVDGFIFEVHPSPEYALYGGNRCVDLDNAANIMRAVTAAQLE